MTDKQRSESLELEVVYDRVNDMRVIGPFLNKAGLAPDQEHVLAVTVDRIHINVLHGERDSERAETERLNLREFLHKYGGGLLGVVQWSEDPEHGILKIMYFMPDELRTDVLPKRLVHKHPNN